MARKHALKLPVFRWLGAYDRSWTRGDVIAGLTVWAVLVPEALAYAQLAGVSPVVGLYAAPAALIFYAALGSSRHLIVGPMSTTAVISASAVGELAKGGSSDFVALTAGLAVMIGILGILAGVARLGFVSSFISEPVIKGFVIGIALTIIAGQLPEALRARARRRQLLREAVRVLQRPRQHPRLDAARRILVARPRVPPPARCSDRAGGARRRAARDRRGRAVRPRRRGRRDRREHPERPAHVGFPDIALGDFLDLAPAAIGILLVGYAEGLGAAKTYADRDGYRIDPNRELIGLGTANFTSGFASGMVVNGSLSKTAVNGSAGAKSQLSGLVAAALVILTLLFLTGLFEKLPEATLGAVVIVALAEVVDIPALRRLWRVYSPRLRKAQGLTVRADFLAAIAALLGVLVFDTLPGLFVGIAVSILLLLLYRASRPYIASLGRSADGERFDDLQRHPDDQTVPGVAILRPESGLFFANNDRIRDAIEQEAAKPGTRAVVLDAESIPAIDITGAEMLDRLAATLHGRGVTLALARQMGQTRDVLRRAREDDDTTLQVYPTVRAAVAALEASASS